MHITVPNIQIDETINRLIVTIDFSEAMKDGCAQSASVIVYLPLDEGAALAEIETAALQSAFDFLRAALAVHSAQGHP